MTGKSGLKTTKEFGGASGLTGFQTLIALPIETIRWQVSSGLVAMKISSFFSFGGGYTIGSLFSKRPQCFKHSSNLRIKSNVSILFFSKA